MEKKTIQDIQFELMEQSSFNGFDGKKIVKSLKKYKDLWRGVVLDRADICFHGRASAFGELEYSERIDLIKLRDIEDDVWNVDTLFILPKEGKEDELEKVAKRWGADEIDWIGGREASMKLGNSSMKNDKQILRVWFD